MASNAKFCSQCAHELPEPNPPFCSDCGASVSASAPPVSNKDSSRSNTLPVLLNAVFGAICLLGVGHIVERRFRKGGLYLLAGWLLLFLLINGNVVILLAEAFGMLALALFPVIYIALWIYSIVEARRF